MSIIHLLYPDGENASIVSQSLSAFIPHRVKDPEQTSPILRKLISPSSEDVLDWVFMPIHSRDADIDLRDALDYTPSGHWAYLTVSCLDSVQVPDWIAFERKDDWLPFCMKIGVSLPCFTYQEMLVKNANSRDIRKLLDAILE